MVGEKMLLFSYDSDFESESKLHENDHKFTLNVIADEEIKEELSPVYVSDEAFQAYEEDRKNSCSKIYQEFAEEFPKASVVLISNTEKAFIIPCKKDGKYQFMLEVYDYNTDTRTYFKTYDKYEEALRACRDMDITSVCSENVYNDLDCHRYEEWNRDLTTGCYTRNFGILFQNQNKIWFYYNPVTGRSFCLNYREVKDSFTAMLKLDEIYPAKVECFEENDTLES